MTAAQTRACQEALTAFLDFKNEDEIELPERYLLAVAFSTHPSEQVLNDLLVSVFCIFTRGDSISPIKAPKCSFLRTNMQCGYIKVIRMKRGSSNYKMIVAS